MTVHVTRADGVTQDFTRSADEYVKHSDGSLEIIRGGTAPPQWFPVGRWIAVTGDRTRRRRNRFHHLIQLFINPSTGN